ncbi:Holo-[acyl-carrier-protein] synthase [Rickettsiales endosymbiont of Paramecium tredecaurelia]|uniref:holo-ACP synthase n=1 Tax=Candidatus Sarmatiella mevalonica TaxID=2770581 RepID=UPI001923198A|nr:holo-ACP synthase [Candidatus Sarmatiella mevalonica]MBL3285054.1 Holo-[acyl-carrier-protein] synthase [Candidatus Sarmatiella mevalonica]
MIGVDIVDIARIEAAWKRHGMRLASRILCAQELVEFGRSHHQPHVFLAKRFAAKEAVSKALGVGIGAHLSFQDIIITHDSAGKPEAIASNNIFRNTRLHLSLADDAGVVVAYAMMFNKHH